MEILIIDDEQAFLLCLKEFLEGPGFSVDTAETFEDAVFLIKNKNYDYVISDVRLTGVLAEEGLDILRTLKEYKPTTKVIIITGYDNQAVKEKAYGLGAYLYFEKPVSAEALKEAMKCERH